MLGEVSNLKPYTSTVSYTINPMLITLICHTHTNPEGMTLL